MRTPHLLTVTAVVALALGLSACSDDPKDETTTAATTQNDTAAKDDSADTAAAGSGDFCAVATEAFGSFDPSALAAGDPAALHEIADAFRTASESAEGDAQAAWSGYADFIDLSADVIEDPSKAGDLATQAQDATSWMTGISESMASCA